MSYGNTGQQASSAARWVFQNATMSNQQKHSKRQEVHDATSIQAANSTQKMNTRKHQTFVCTEIYNHPG